MEIKVGDKIRIRETYDPEDGKIKVMAIADNYVMARFKGCIPFAISVKDLKRKADLLKGKGEGE